MLEESTTTCLALALSKYERVETIAFDYRQRHRVELCLKPPTPITPAR